jgi:hypothetical protein
LGVRRGEIRVWEGTFFYSLSFFCRSTLDLSLSFWGDPDLSHFCRSDPDLSLFYVAQLSICLSLFLGES